MQLNHAPAAVSAVFDDPNLVSAAGLVPMLRLADAAGLSRLARERLTVPGDRGANAGAKVASLVAGMLAGADSIDDMRLLRHGGMPRLFNRVYAPSTLGSFLRACTFGHVRQLDAIASRLLVALAERAPLLSADAGTVLVDVDDTIVEVHGYQKQAASYGYSRVRGLNALIATASTASSAPVIVGQRLRRGSVNSAKGAGGLIAEAVVTCRRAVGDVRVLLRADSAYYTLPAVSAAVRAGADVSVTVRMFPNVKAAIADIDEEGWEPISYPRAIRDEATGEWISDAEVAEVPFAAFKGRRNATQASGDPIRGRLIVRRVKAHQDRPDAPALFQTWRYHAFFTTVSAERADTVAADRTHRGHAIIEQVHADLKSGPLAHLPSGKFTANSAWLTLATIAFNLARAAGVLADTSGRLARATTATIRRTLVHVPARLASSARRITMHLPRAWPWQHAFTRLLIIANAPPAPAT